ncbi:helix-turn-helix transcriptional regulator [Bacillus sp. UNCCL81]|uniref:helix-turn-helix transcriptional regulator n=1 Tax=Bacillus sp. UNCCL81 TaxID=1502755 RepID=UPI00040081E9|nr:helix-turn-helix transcriptional regulator [Bacillus sp. UNCCL81]SFD60780.1 Helix-turn-helix [Bacillus sp. UNCCL81]
MKVEIELKEETIQRIQDYVDYYNTKKRLNNKTENTTVEDIIKAAIAIYLSWRINDPPQEIKQGNFKVSSMIREVFEERDKSQTEAAQLCKISKSTMNSIWNGNLPSLDNFIKIWLALGKPDIEKLIKYE